MSQILGNKKKGLKIRACLHPPTLSIERNGAQIDVQVVFPLVILGIFLMSMVMFSSRIDEGLSSILNYGLFYLTFSTIMIIILHSSIRAYKSFQNKK